MYIVQHERCWFDLIESSAREFPVALIIVISPVDQVLVMEQKKLVVLAGSSSSEYIYPIIAGLSYRAPFPEAHRKPSAV